MDILQILATLNIKVLRYNLPVISYYYDVDYYLEYGETVSTILYISDHCVDHKNVTFIYTNDIEGLKENYIVVDCDREYLFHELHHYFIKTHHYIAYMQPFLNYFLSGNVNSVKQVVDVSTRILDNPIIVTNAAYKVLAINDNGVKVDDPTFDKAMTYGYCSSDSIMTFEYEGITQKVLSTEHTILLNTGMASKIPRILGKIVINEKVVAYIGVLQVTKIIEEEDIKITENICHLLKNLMMRDATVLDTTNIIYESLIKELLEHKIDNQFILNERLSSSRWNLKEYLRCSIITTSNKLKHIDNTSYLSHKIANTFALKVITYKDQILVINNYDDNKEWERQLNFIEKEAEMLSLKVGVSREFIHLIDLSRYYDEAVKVVDIALTLDVKDTVVEFAAFLPYYLISKSDSDTLDQCENTFYEKLNNYDLQHETEYVITLYYYVLYNCNINKTAKRFYVHRNTLAHRIEKIVEISGIDINNGIMLQNYVLYCQIKNYQNKLKQKKGYQYENSNITRKS